jgi:hypothetical protein
MSGCLEPKTTEERYGAAIGADDLTLSPSRCSVDYLISAGWVKDGLGAALFRLRTEWDATKAELRLGGEAARDGYRQSEIFAKLAAQGQQRAAQDFAAIEMADPCKRAEAQELASAAYQHARLKAKAALDATLSVEHAAITARALIMTHMNSLGSAKDALYEFAVAFGARSRFYDAREVRAVAARALQLWLDPNCPHCDGRGFTGGFREAVRWCHECDKSGKRVQGRRGFRLHRSETGHQFGRALLVEMDRKCDKVERDMRMYLHSQRGPDAKASAAQSAALKERLAELRSPQAQED